MAKHKRNADDEKPGSAPAFDHTRWTNTLFGFWQSCGARICKRRRRCAGDAKACFDRFWPLAPERKKFEYRMFIKALAAGRSPEEALCEAEAEARTPRAVEFIASAEAARLAAIAAQDEARKRREQETLSRLRRLRLRNRPLPAWRGEGKRRACARCDVLRKHLR